MKTVSYWLCLALMLVACAPGPSPEGAMPRRAESSTKAKAAFRAGGGGGAVLFRFLVIGDWGTGNATQYALGRRMCERRKRRPFDLVITTGDNIYPAGEPEDFPPNFYRPFACLLENGVRFRSTLGNHDVLTDGGRPELNEPRFGMKARNYVVRRSGVRFVLANSNRINRDWLRRATRAEPGDRWTIVAFHHPVYSPGTGHGSTDGFRPSLPRIFRRRGVDLVLNGHDHIYAVTKPLRRIRYVVTGGGSAPLYGCRSKWFSAVCRERHHFLEVAVTSTEVVVRAVPPEGRPFHVFRTRGRS